MRKHRCRNDAARVQERCSTGAARVQERCSTGAEGANAGSASMLCVHSIAMHAGESDIDGAGKRNMLAVCLHCLHFSEQRITARRGGKRGVREEMRGIVRRVPTCGAFRRAAGGRRGGRGGREGLRRKATAAGDRPARSDVRRGSTSPVAPDSTVVETPLLRRRMPDPLAGAGRELPLVRLERLEPARNPVF